MNQNSLSELIGNSVEGFPFQRRSLNRILQTRNHIGSNQTPEMAELAFQLDASKLFAVNGLVAVITGGGSGECALLFQNCFLPSLSRTCC